MSRIVSFTLLACVLSLSLVPIVRAGDEPPDAEQIQRGKLEAEIADLRSQIIALQDRLFVLQRQLDLLGLADGTPPADADPIIAGASQTLPSVMQEKPTTDDTDDESGNDTDKQEKPFRSGADILKRIPRELIPKPEEMTDSFKIRAINDWLASEMVGKEMQVKCVVTSPRTSRTFSPRRTEDRQWTLNLGIAERATTRFGVVQVQSNYFRSAYNSTMRRYYPQPIRYEGDNDFKKQADRIEAGHVATVAGTIRVIELKHSILSKPNWTLSIAIDNPTVDIERLRKYSGNLVTE